MSDLLNIAHTAAANTRSPPPKREKKDKADSGEFIQNLEKHQKRQNEYGYLAKVTHFDETTLQLLHLRFTRIDSSIEENGSISIGEFANVLGISSKSLLLKRFFNFMDRSDMGELNFRNFAMAMSMLSDKAPIEDKIELSFIMYDLNGDGKVDKEELKRMVIAALEHVAMNLGNDQIDAIVENTFELADANRDGFIDKEEYSVFCRNNPRILQPYSVDVTQLIHYEQESRRHHRVPKTQYKPLTHGPMQAPSKGRLKRLRRRMGKGLSKVSKEKVERVRSIHAPVGSFFALPSSNSKPPK